MIRAITFDVGGTLIEKQKSVFEKLPKEVSVHKAEIKNILYTVKEYTDCEEKLLLRFLKPEQISLLKFYYTEQKEIKLKPFVADLFARLSKNYTLAIASNRHCLSRNYVNFDSVSKYISRFFYSNEIGIAKPSELFFKKCSEILDIPCSQILHVGDSLNSDFNCAEKAGCRSLLWNTELSDTDNLKNLFEKLKSLA